MPKFVIERIVPGIADWSETQIRDASLKSLSALADLGPDIQWIHSFVTDDKMYCVVLRPGREPDHRPRAPERLPGRSCRRGPAPARSVQLSVAGGPQRGLPRQGDGPVERQRRAGAASRAGAGVVERPQFGDVAVDPRPLMERAGGEGAARSPHRRRRSGERQRPIAVAIDERGTGEGLERDGDAEPLIEALERVERLAEPRVRGRGIAFFTGELAEIDR